MARFTTSARAVDMLGRQQIAGIPTALSELFKNAYDAYARQCRVDYLPERRLLLLRDDGVGMSEVDFHQRWLTLATDSKARHSSAARPPRPDGVLPRPTMGEKGIGRLAIASIGPLLLVVTRALRPPRGKQLRPVLTALVPWTLFQTPGLVLDDVDVPTLLLDDIRGFNGEALQGLAGGIRANLDRLNPPDPPLPRLPMQRASDHHHEDGGPLRTEQRVPDELAEQLLRELDSLDFDPARYFELPGPSLTGEGHGTHFLVCSVSEDLPAALQSTDREQGEATATPLQRLLVGFTDTMLPDRPPAPMKTMFMVHRPKQPPENLIDPEEFWKPKDFLDVDHDIQGGFDRHGTFHGSVSIYQQEAQSCAVVWTPGGQRPSRCGPFTIRIGYVQGNSTESRLDLETYSEMSRKLARIGGLYIYRDGIRVQPYGSADVDYLNIEERRSRRASRYYFSYRRMFGAIEIGSDANPDLVDKASREGFRENGAFRDFKAVLENFLIEIARDYFNKGGDQSTEWQEYRDQLKADQKRRRELDMARSRAAKLYQSHLEDALASLEDGRTRKEISKVLQETQVKLSGVVNDGAASRVIAKIEREGRDRLASIVDQVTVDPPVQLGLTTEQRRDVAAHSQMLRRLRSEDIPAAVRSLTAAVDNSVDSEATRTELLKIRFEGLRSIAAAGRENVATAADDAVSAAERASRHAALVARECLEAARSLLTAAEQQLVEMPDESERQRVLAELELSMQEQQTRLRALTKELDAVSTGRAGEDNVLLQEQVLDLQQQSEANLELLLLGQAVQVIDHELEASVKAMRNGLQRLRPLVRKDARLSPIVGDAYSAFEHLDGYLRLFTPLQRRLYRKRAEVSGDSIAGFVQRVFAERLERLGVDLVATRTFRDSVVHAFPSTFFPVFVNLVDNALHWISTGRQEDGFVRLDADEHGLLVIDNGPGIRERDRDAIFARGFSRRPGGRGLGLTLSRDALAREQPPWALELVEAQPAQGTAFRLSPMKNDSKESS